MNPQRIPFFGANWKMNKNLQEAQAFFTENAALHYDFNHEVVYFPPALYLLPLKQAIPAQYLLGAQNFYFEDQGAYTGEISSWMLKEEGISYALVGHSERRAIFKEEDTLLEKKIHKGLALGLKIVFCVGETLPQREQNQHFNVIENQLKLALAHAQLKNSSQLVIAYEPVWAIGTGKNASPAQAQEIHQFIRLKLQELNLPAQEIRIIYGGSVKPENINELMRQKDIDGALVGGASLKPADFFKIAQYQKA